MVINWLPVTIRAKELGSGEFFWNGHFRISNQLL